MERLNTTARTCKPLEGLNPLVGILIGQRAIDR
jgi:hypothetical protein